MESFNSDPTKILALSFREKLKYVCVNLIENMNPDENPIFALEIVSSRRSLAEFPKHLLDQDRVLAVIKDESKEDHLELHCLSGGKVMRSYPNLSFDQAFTVINSFLFSDTDWDEDDDASPEDTQIMLKQHKGKKRKRKSKNVNEEQTQKDGRSNEIQDQQEEEEEEDVLLACHLCGKMLKKKSLLPHLKLVHDGDKYRNHFCQECGKAYKTKAMLAKHLFSHTGDRPFCCSYCGKTFRENDSWLNCERRCSGNFRHECPDCNKKFNKKSRFESHLRTHSGEKPFSCPRCTYQCSRKDNLQSHAKKMHSLSIQETNVAIELNSFYS